MTADPHPTEASDRTLVLGAQPIGPQMPGLDPFLFAAYHDDAYPAGNGRLGLSAPQRAGREPGMDFSRRDGFSLYHGDAVPGFPGHPHRGFETVTIVRRGLVDHADSLGASARYGEGDVQWLTTGRGVQHSEMFPLLHTERANPLELFQIWLNLPARAKLAPPGFSMFWAEDIPRASVTDADGRRAEVEVIAGDYLAPGARPVRALAPPPDSWASQPEAEVAIWVLRLDPGARLMLPAASARARRALYFVQGDQLRVGAQGFAQRAMVEVRADRPTPLANPGSDVAELLVLQGRPLGEPVAARGPFVMNTPAELAQAVRDYQQTGFGGWPWPSPAPTLGHAPRFARHPDGRLAHPPAARG